MRRLRVQLTVLLALLGLLVVAWGATVFLGAHTAADSSTAMEVMTDRGEQLRRDVDELGTSFIEAESSERDALRSYDEARSRTAELMAAVRTGAAPWLDLTPTVEAVADAYRSWIRTEQQEIDDHRRAAGGQSRDQGGGTSAGEVWTGERALAADLARSRRDFSVLRARQRMLVSELSSMQVAAARTQASTYRTAQKLALTAACMVLGAVALLA